ncbi:MAG: Holliday junction branch migration protein RuvA [Pseudomonadota bacterium]
MIVRLSGELVDKHPPMLVLDVAGVGYQVEVPMSVFDGLPALGTKITLLIHSVIREDAHLLFGFSRSSDRSLFAELLKISGVGPRLALGILSGISAADFAMMVEAGDAKSLTRLPGIGQKTAERLVLEMRTRLDGLGLSANSASIGAATKPDVSSEARAGLIALGYSSSEAMKMVRKAAEDAGSEGISPEAIIRQALKNRMRQ